MNRRLTTLADLQGQPEGAVVTVQPGGARRPWVFQATRHGAPSDPAAWQHTEDSSVHRAEVIAGLLPATLVWSPHDPHPTGTRTVASVSELDDEAVGTVAVFDIDGRPTPLVATRRTDGVGWCAPGEVHVRAGEHMGAHLPAQVVWSPRDPGPGPGPEVEGEQVRASWNDRMRDVIRAADRSGLLNRVEQVGRDLAVEALRAVRGRQVVPWPGADGRAGRKVIVCSQQGLDQALAEFGHDPHTHIDIMRATRVSGQLQVTLRSAPACRVRAWADPGVVVHVRDGGRLDHLDVEARASVAGTGSRIENVAGGRVLEVRDGGQITHLWPDPAAGLDSGVDRLAPGGTIAHRHTDPTGRDRDPVVRHIDAGTHLAAPTPDGGRVETPVGPGPESGAAGGAPGPTGFLDRVRAQQPIAGPPGPASQIGGPR